MSLLKWKLWMCEVEIAPENLTKAKRNFEHRPVLIRHEPLPDKPHRYIVAGFKNVIEAWAARNGYNFVTFVRLGIGTIRKVIE